MQCNILASKANIVPTHMRVDHTVGYNVATCLQATYQKPPRSYPTIALLSIPTNVQAPHPHGQPGPGAVHSRHGSANKHIGLQYTDPLTCQHVHQRSIPKTRHKHVPNTDAADITPPLLEQLRGTTHGIRSESLPGMPVLVNIPAYITNT